MNNNRTQVFTLGYQPWTIQELLAKRKELDAIVVDIRQMPTSKLPCWTKSNLEEALAPWYIHLQELGNVAYRDRKEIIINDMEAGMSKLTAVLETSNVILLCACLNPFTCHRQTIAEEINKRTERPFTHLIHHSQIPVIKQGATQLSLF